MLVRFTGVGNKLPLYISADMVNFVYHSTNPLGTVIATKCVQSTREGMQNLCYVVQEGSAECAERINAALEGKGGGSILATQ